MLEGARARLAVTDALEFAAVEKRKIDGDAEKKNDVVASTAMCAVKLQKGLTQKLNASQSTPSLTRHPSVAIAYPTPPPAASPHVMPPRLGMVAQPLDACASAAPGAALSDASSVTAGEDDECTPE